MTDNVLKALQALAAEGKIELSTINVVYRTTAPIEPLVPDTIIEAFEERYRKLLDFSRPDYAKEWGNTDRYKHDGVQVLWEGWRDCYIMLRDAVVAGDIDRFQHPSARGM